MTQEEANEYNRLLSEYKALCAENARLQAEINSGIANCEIVAGNISYTAKRATQKVGFVSEKTDTASITIDDLYKLIVEVTQQYFVFKNLSEASKKLTQYNDEYFTKFKFYNELRRITLGYVVGIDSHIVSSESLRKKVEKAYLANTDYWLAYAISAVMLWASNEKEAAYRALNKSMSMDGYKSCVFFMLVNLRFNRMKVAKNWYISLLDKTDVNNVSEQWQHVLHAYLNGAMSRDREFTDMVGEYFKKMMEQAEATCVDYSRKIMQRADGYARSYIYVTEKEYPLLKDTCSEYDEMKKLLSDMEKIGDMAKHYEDVYRMEEEGAENNSERVENILYDLISAYDDQEFKVVKEIKYNEAVLAAKGDLDLANAKINEIYGNMQKNKTFGDLMIKWAFAEDYVETDVVVQRFALSHLKDRISKGVHGYFVQRYSQLKERYVIDVGADVGGATCPVECNENEYSSASSKIAEHYNKNRMKYIMADNNMKIFLFMCAGALALIAIAAILIGTKAFAVVLSLGIALGVVSGFLVWRRWVDLGKEIEEACRLSLVKLRNTLEEMSVWRRLVVNGFKELENLVGALDRF